MPIYEFTLNAIIRLFLFTHFRGKMKKPMKTLIRLFFANMMVIL